MPDPSESLRLVVAGQPHWAEQLAGEIRRHATDVEVLVARAPICLPVQVARVRPRALLIVGFRPGAPTLRGRAFDAIVRLVRWRSPATHIVRYWIGTDVDHSVQDASAGRLTGAFEASKRLDRHLAAAPWLVAELNVLGINAGFVAHPSELPQSHGPCALPEHFRVLSYVGEGRFEFYGGPTILAAARLLPAVDFDIVGCMAPVGLPVPPNVAFLGWRADLDQLMIQCSALIRLTRHDAMSLTVREALVRGRFVIWTYELTAVDTVPPDDPIAVVARLRDLAARHAEGTLRPNELGRQFALREFDPRELVKRLVIGILG